MRTRRAAAVTDPVQKTVAEKRAMFGGKKDGIRSLNPTAAAQGSSSSSSGGDGDVAAILAARRKKVDASIVGEDELDTPDVDDKGKGRVKRSQEAMHKVMEARRVHVESMERKMREMQGGVDADEALAMGAHTVRESERKRVLGCDAR
eukprot:Tamp_35387.p2 GENE.Tamp_35387~~Tamp_35387.p2  ORF type:complete len:172 (+),score=45.05 Tamp_35387:74-517(+)